MENFIQLQDEIFTFLCQERPVNATYLGIKGYDTYLDNFEQKTLLHFDQQREEYLEKLRNIDQSALAINLSVDYDMLKHKLESDLELHHKNRAPYRNANIYLE